MLEIPTLTLEQKVKQTEMEENRESVAPTTQTQTNPKS